MNKEQLQALKSSTYYLITTMDNNLELMKEHGMSKTDIKKVDNAINILYQLNQKFVKLQKAKQNE